MIIHSDNFEILDFFAYPSYQQNIIAIWNENEKRGDRSVQRFFEEILKMGEQMYHKKLMDNKIVFKLRLKNTNSIIYCGYKDCEYRISLSATTESLLKNL